MPAFRENPCEPRAVHISRGEKSGRLCPYHQNVCAIDNLGNAAVFYGVPPGIEITAEPLRQTARLGDRIPEIVQGGQVVLSEIDNQFAHDHTLRGVRTSAAQISTGNPHRS